MLTNKKSEPTGFMLVLTYFNLLSSFRSCIELPEHNTLLKQSSGLFRSKTEPRSRTCYFSGCRESNPDHTHPMRAHYHYATPRQIVLWTICRLALGKPLSLLILLAIIFFKRAKYFKWKRYYHCIRLIRT